MAVRVRASGSIKAGWASLCAAALVVGCMPPSLPQARTSPADPRDVGGFVLVYEFDGDKPAKPAETARILGERLRNFGLATDASVRLLEDDRLEISLPLFPEGWLEHAYFMIENPGEVEFRILAKPDADVDVVEAVEGSDEDAGEAASTGRKWKWVRFDRSSVELSELASVLRGLDGENPETLLLVGPVDLDRSHVESASGIFIDVDRPAISGTMTKGGALRLEALTSRNLPEQSGGPSLMGIVVDGRLIAAPVINATISDKFMIDLSPPMPRAAALAATLSGDALPARLKQVSIERFDVPER